LLDPLLGEVLESDCLGFDISFILELFEDLQPAPLRFPLRLIALPFLFLIGGAVFEAVTPPPS
jgi:hypothetical protein